MAKTKLNKVERAERDARHERVLAKRSGRASWRSKRRRSLEDRPRATSAFETQTMRLGGPGAQALEPRVGR